MTTNWYNNPITNPFGLAGGESNLGGHSGVDIGTPNNTPLYFPVGGKVIVSDYKYFGGEVVIQASNGLQYVFLHVNNILANVGQTVQAGQVVATSGGGVGDKLLKNGVVTTATSQADFGGSSTGYHTHFSIFSGSSINDFFNSLDGNVNRVNPTATINQLNSGNLAPLAITATTSSSTSNSGSSPVLGLPSQAQISHFGMMIGLFILALVFCIFGFYLLFSKQVNSAVVSSVKTAGKAAILA